MNRWTQQVNRHVSSFNASRVQRRIAKWQECELERRLKQIAKHKAADCVGKAKGKTGRKVK